MVSGLISLNDSGEKGRERERLSVRNDDFIWPSEEPTIIILSSSERISGSLRLLFCGLFAMGISPLARLEPLLPRQA